MTQILEARKGNVTPEMEAVARAEGVSLDHVLEGVANGTIVITRNARHTSITPLGIGKGLRTKINANIGTSKDRIGVGGVDATQNGVGSRLITYLSLNQGLGAAKSFTLYGFDVLRGQPQLEQTAVGAAVLPRGNLLALGARFDLGLAPATTVSPNSLRSSIGCRSTLRSAATCSSAVSSGRECVTAITCAFAAAVPIRPASAGSSSAARMAITAMTTSSSIRVNPASRFMIVSSEPLKRCVDN